MERTLGIFSYGLCLFSAGVLRDFRTREKLRAQKLVGKFQKDEALYLASQREGVWVPLVQIDSVGYRIRLAGQDAPFGPDWERKFSYSGFNLAVQDGLWVADIGVLEPLRPEELQGDGCLWENLEGEPVHRGLHYDVPAGNYLLTVEGYARKGAAGHDSSKTDPDYGYWFALEPVADFDGFQNPREDALYDFNIGWLTRSREADIHWLPAAEGGRAAPPAGREYAFAVELENGEVWNLIALLDRRGPVEAGTVDRCRVSTLFHFAHDALLVSGRTYPISEEVRKRGKTVYQQVGRLVLR